MYDYSPDYYLMCSIEIDLMANYQLKQLNKTCLGHVDYYLYEDGFVGWEEAGEKIFEYDYSDADGTYEDYLKSIDKIMKGYNELKKSRETT